jgi:prepilin-type N-terminal cleavage/methylation domain-containing protein
MVRSRADQRSVSAFTLIELLVVVAIIALLMSIRLPSRQRAKKQARQVVCLTNLREQGKAARFYAADNKDYVPRAIQGFPQDEYHIYATGIISYLGWNGEVGVALEVGEVFEVGSDANQLWKWWGNSHQWQRRAVFNRIMRSIPQLQCPDYPVGIE